MFNRLLTIDAHSRHSYMLFGPRGTGKTSWLRLHFKDCIYFDLLKEDTYTHLLGDATRLDAHIPEGYNQWVIIDEIQKIPALLDEVHRLIEGRNLRFILTGSSARKLKRSGVNLLAGRALIKHMHPVTAIEQAKDFDLAKSLKTGHLPTALLATQSEEFLKSYVATYLKEEVLQESLTRNIALFARFLETASFSQGETLNYTEIAREIGSSRHTVENFFAVLEDLLISIRLPVFTKRAKRDVVRAPKFYFFDVGVYRAIRPVGVLDSPEEIDGAALETLFLQEVRAINDYYDFGYEFYYWRTRTQQEVDFVLYGKYGLIAIEIKRKKKVSRKDTKGLVAFKNDYPMASCYLLYGGTEKQTLDGVTLLPMSLALTQLDVLLRNPAD